VDALSEVLSICRAERAVTARFALTSPWGLASDGTPGVIIRLAREASYWMMLHDKPPLQVRAGDLVMLLPGVPHRIASTPDAPATPFAELIDRHAVGPRGENPLVFSHGGGGTLTDLYSAQLWFSAYCRHTVLRILPPVLHIREADLPLASCLATTMQLLIEETLARRPGWRLSGARMGELLLVNLLREHLAHQDALNAGWLRGLSDPAIASAIGQMHRQPQHPWTLDALATDAGMSRTRFTARFKTLVDASPMNYLTGHRMALAAQALEAGQVPMARIASDAGYESEKAFARAFRRWAGMPPGAYARGQAAGRGLTASLRRP
jgi:AraC-like DNA-binding protein